MAHRTQEYILLANTTNFLSFYSRIKSIIITKKSFLSFFARSKLNQNAYNKKYSGLTLIELIVTITIISISFMLLGSRLGLSNFWKEEAFLRKFRETITFLHQQAVVDQTYYRLDFDFEDQSYKVSAIRSDQEQLSEEAEKQLITNGVGYLSQELSLILSPAIGKNYELVTPESFPSMAKKILLPSDMSFSLIKTQRGEFSAQDKDQTYLLFSPRGYSEFAAIYINQGEFGKITIFINPFSGNTELYREEKEFNWSYTKVEQDSES